MKIGTDVEVVSPLFTGKAKVSHIHGDDCIVIDPEGKPGKPLVVGRRSCTEIVTAPVLRHPIKRTDLLTFVVGLAGPKGVGKSVTAEALRLALRHYAIPMEVRSFAGPLYQAVSIITGVPEYILRSRSVKDRPLTEKETSNPCVIGKTPREILEWEGEGVRQFFGVDHWIHLAFGTLPKFERPSDKAPITGIVVFDDARHGPEFEATDINFELMRAGLKYPGNHPSAMPPDPKYITETIHLDGFSPQEVGERLATLITSAMARKLNKQDPNAATSSI